MKPAETTCLAQKSHTATLCVCVYQLDAALLLKIIVLNWMQNVSNMVQIGSNKVNNGPHNFKAMSQRLESPKVWGAPFSIDYTQDVHYL